MNATELAHALPAPVAVIAGILICFFGYRILKLTLAIIGFIAAAGAGWTFGSSLAPNNSGVALICAVVAGIIGAALCVWLFFLGVFVVGASAGVIVGAAFFNAAGNQPQPILLVVLAVVFGIVALVMQKFMIIASTAFSGSYLLVAGGIHLLNHTHDDSLLWFDRLHARSSGMLGYVALGLWIALGLVGLSFQYRHSQLREKAAHPEPKSPP
ncbi:MAG TPA: DUF4203 domain-containing protein [Verrucomicrobiae bacterium]|nr:DUF4203 domain-containing protein [Verrucomicrobiae bacterium]